MTFKNAIADFAVNHSRSVRALALWLLLATLCAFPIVGWSQTNPSENPSSSGSSPVKQINPTGSGRNVLPSLSSGAFSTYCLYHTDGFGVFYCWDSSINANSRVFAAISEYSTTPTNRFLGAAHMTIHNIIPFNGGVKVLIDTGWSAFPINLRLDLLVDP